MLMQAACQNMGWKIWGQWCVIPPESFRTGKKKKISWYLQLLLDSNFMSSCYFWEKRQGIYPDLYKLLLRQSDLAKGPGHVHRELHPIAKASKSSKQFDVWRSLSFSFFLYPSTSYPPFFHCSSFFERNRHLQHQHTKSFSLSQEWLWACFQSGTPWCSDLWKRSRAAVSDVRIALAPNCTGESLSGLWNSSGVTHC